MTDFFHMGGYAFFVWGSYLIVTVLFVYFYFAPYMKHRNIRNQLARLYAGHNRQPSN